MMPIVFTDGTFTWGIRSTQAATVFVLTTPRPMDWTMTIHRDLIGPGREDAVAQLLEAADYVNMPYTRTISDYVAYTEAISD